MAWQSLRSVGFAVGWVALVAVAGSPTSAYAEPVMTEVEALARPFGVGVHAYFSGDAQGAYEDLTQAIEAGTRDPRAWYFRGLAALKLGRLDEAEADFSTGAAKETEAAGTWAVARSLERIQGRDRLALERHRVRARVARYEQTRDSVELRYSQLDSRQGDVLRRKRPADGSPAVDKQFGAVEVEELQRPDASDGVPGPAVPNPAQPPAVEDGDAGNRSDGDAQPPVDAAGDAGTDAGQAGDQPAAYAGGLDPAAPAEANDAPMAEDPAAGDAPAAPEAPGVSVFGS